MEKGAPAGCRLLRLRPLAALFLVLAPLAGHAETILSLGSTGQHDAQRGQVYMLDWASSSDSPWDFTAGAIRGIRTTPVWTRGTHSHGMRTRDTSWVAASYQIVDQHLFAAFGLALIRHQTTTLTSQYQFMTTFGFHHGDWFLATRHLSNGGLHGANIGETLVILGWSF